MPVARQLPPISRRATGRAGGAWWLARWLLVLVLAFDHLSAPFHDHRHDGAEAQLEFAAAHGSAHDDDGTHAESDEHRLQSHAAMAIRVNPSRLAQLPALDGADAPIAPASVVDLLDALNEPLPTRWRPDRSPPDFRSHRSLPPAGHAPPLHA